MTITTERLILRQFTLEDADFVIALLNSDGWLQYIGDRNVHSCEDARAYLQNKYIKTYTESPIGLLCVTLKHDATPIGMCGLVDRDFLPHYDIGFGYLPQYYRQGYGYESAVAVLEIAKQQFDINKVLAMTVTYNNNCIALLQKLDFVFQENINIPNDETLMLFQRQLG